jgi:hypothetical protein
MGAAPARIRVSPFRQVVVLAFLALLVFLIVRTQVRGDDRWGFSMFRDITMVTLSYEWVYPDGSTRPVVFDGILYGDARMMQNRRRPLDWILGYYAYADMAGQVVQYLGEQRLPEGAVGVRAKLRSQPWGQGPWHEEVIVWPATDVTAGSAG